MAQNCATKKGFLELELIKRHSFSFLKLEVFNLHRLKKWIILELALAPQSWSFLGANTSGVSVWQYFAT